MSRCPGARDLDSTQKVTIARIKHVDFLDSKNDVPADTKLDDEKHCLLLEEDTPRGWIVIQCINRLGSRYFERSSMVEHSALYVGIHAESFDPVFAWGGSNFLRPDDEFFVLCSADEIIFDEQHLRRKDGTTTAKLADELPFSERKSKVSFSQLLQDPEFRHRQEARDERFLTGEPHVVDCDPANLDLPVRLAAIEGYADRNFFKLSIPCLGSIRASPELMDFVNQLRGRLMFDHIHNNTFLTAIFVWVNLLSPAARKEAYGEQPNLKKDNLYNFIAM